MNYYEHHLGDYLRDTAHLSMLEDGAYRRLIDAYYIRETPLPVELRDVFRLVRAQSKHDREAVETVLREFFNETDAGWVHNRCDREIARFQDKQRKAKASAAARWERRPEHTEGNANASPDAMRTHSEGNAPRARPQTPDTRHHSCIRDAELAGAPQAPPPPPAPFSGEGDFERLNGRTVVELSPTWELPTDWGVDAERLGWTVEQVLRESERFRQFWAAGRGHGKRRSVRGWRQAWSNWLAKAERMQR